MPAGRRWLLPDSSMVRGYLGVMHHIAWTLQGYASGYGLPTALGSQSSLAVGGSWSQLTGGGCSAGLQPDVKGRVKHMGA